MSTKDWPSQWGKQHEAVCAFNSITTRLCRMVGGESVELWKWKNGTDQKYCLGAVPVEIDYKALTIVITAMIESYGRGFADGQAALAAAIQAPIALALQERK